MCVYRHEIKDVYIRAFNEIKYSIPRVLLVETEKSYMSIEFLRLEVFSIWRTCFTACIQLFLTIYIKNNLTIF